MIKSLTIAVSAAFLLTLAGCSSQTRDINLNSLGLNSLSPNTKMSLVGAGTGIMLGAAGGALVGSALIGAPGLGAGLGALIGAGAGWAVARQEQKIQAQLAENEQRIRQQQAEIEENHRFADNRINLLEDLRAYRQTADSQPIPSTGVIRFPL